MGGRLLIAGKMREDHEHRFFAEHLKPLLGDDVVYLGEVPHDEEVRLLTGATALVDPLRWPEPFGMMMVEALACGTPVVAYRYATAPEIIDDGVTGYLCDDLDDMTARLTDVRYLDRTACWEAAAERFTARRMVAGYVAPFERVPLSRQLSANGRHATRLHGQRSRRCAGRRSSMPPHDQVRSRLPGGQRRLSGSRLWHHTTSRPIWRGVRHA